MRWREPWQFEKPFRPFRWGNPPAEVISLHESFPRATFFAADGAAELNLPLEEVIAEVITALKADAARLGLTGTAP